MAWDGKQKIYWRCAGYKRHGCNARAISQVIGGSCFFISFFLCERALPVKLIRANFSIYHKTNRENFLFFRL